MTDQQIHPTWGPIPAGYPAGNDELARLGVRTRHYLSADDGRWHLGFPTDIDYVPYASTDADRKRRAITGELPWRTTTPPIAHRRRPTSKTARALAWLDAPVRAGDRMTRGAGLLALAAGAFALYALVYYATH